MLTCQFTINAGITGFESPASDWEQLELCLDELLIEHPSSSYVFTHDDDELRSYGIFLGDLLILDASLTARDSDLVLANVDGEIICRLLDLNARCLRSDANPIRLSDFESLTILGVVSRSIRRFKSTNRYSIPGLSEYKNLPCSVHELLVPNPESTFLAIAAGDSMMGVGLYDRDVMIVDRMPVVKNRDVVVVNLNHEFACKILDFDRRCLISAHPKHPPVKVLSQDKVSIEGTVTHSIRFHRQSYLINA